MRQNHPIISVVLCTYNRAWQLQNALKSLVAQSLGKSTYEIVVVDNASTDKTGEVVKSFQVQYLLPPILLVSEPTPGLGYARNTGYKNARGRYVAYIDDDCLAPEDWLKSVLACFESVEPEPWSVGGPVFPIYNSPQPSWFKDEYELCTWGEKARFLQPGESFFGNNMAFRKDVLKQYGGFNVRLDMRGEDLCLGGDTELYEHIWACEGDRALFYYSPQVRICHRIPSHRMTVLYRLKRDFASGQSRIYARAPQSSAQRIRLAMCVLASLLWRSGSAMWLTKPHYSLNNFVVEKFGPIAYQMGRLAGCVGLFLPVRERVKRTA